MAGHVAKSGGKTPTSTLEADTDVQVSAPVSRNLQTMFGAIDTKKKAAEAFHIVLTMGSRGVVLASSLPARVNTISLTLIPPSIAPYVTSTSGAGDTLVGATVWALLTHHRHRRHASHTRNGSLRRCDQARVSRALAVGVRAARLTVMSPHSVAPAINAAAIYNDGKK
eukprot:CAMPEP_0170189984 /NCGR_PEP_ID=MMETSP0040_2-20121228/48225_1 /TAXON_ID=641309 /ORGANISM="Lotharella oceanica, Strain CCMP622" /LENGTH=167 /DNA_ID=CAMNT_0010437715 /DNA_START=117 /DNA_END=620 /DNA_ORIENTATION=-